MRLYVIFWDSTVARDGKFAVKMARMAGAVSLSRQRAQLGACPAAQPLLSARRNAALAQLVEHRIRNAEVAGSSPASGTSPLRRQSYSTGRKWLPHGRAAGSCVGRFGLGNGARPTLYLFEPVLGDFPIQSDLDAGGDVPSWPVAERLVSDNRLEMQPLVWLTVDDCCPPYHHVLHRHRGEQWTIHAANISRLP